MRKRNKRAKLHAINDMNRLNIPVYLLNEFNERRKEGKDNGIRFTR